MHLTQVTSSSHHKCVDVSEVGLNSDYVKTQVALEGQMEALRRFTKIAVEVGKPFISTVGTKQGPPTMRASQ